MHLEEEVISFAIQKSICMSTMTNDHMIIFNVTKEKSSIFGWFEQDR